MSRLNSVRVVVAGVLAAAIPLLMVSGQAAWAESRYVEIKLEAKPDSSVVDAAGGGSLTVTLTDTRKTYVVAAAGSSLRFTAPSNLRFTGVPNGRYAGGWIWSQWYRCTLESDAQITCNRSSGYYGQPVRDETIWLPVMPRSGASAGRYTDGRAQFNPGPSLPNKNPVSIPFEYSITGAPPQQPIVDVIAKEPPVVTLNQGTSGRLKFELSQGKTGANLEPGSKGATVVFTAPEGVTFTGPATSDSDWSCRKDSDTKLTCTVIGGEFRAGGGTSVFDIPVAVGGAARPGRHDGSAVFTPADGKRDGDASNNSAKLPVEIKEVQQVPETTNTTQPGGAQTGCFDYWTRYPHRQVEISGNRNSQHLETNTWTDVRCGQVTLQVPKGQKATVTAWANAEVSCGGSGSGWCQARILADGVELEPAEGHDFAWAWTRNGEYHERSLTRGGLLTCPADNPAANCDKKITVQVRTSSPGMKMTVDDFIVRAAIDKGSPATSTPPQRPEPGKPGFLRLADNQDVTIEVKDGDSANNTPIVLRKYDASPKQQWEIDPIKDKNGSIMLRNPLTKKCLDIGSKSRDPKTPLNIWACDIGKYPEQEWKPRYFDDGSFEIYSPYADKCVEQSAQTEGVQLMIAPCDKGKTQRWKWNS